MNKTVQYPMIPNTILAFLLDKAGEAGELSPRHLMPQQTRPNSRQAEELYDAGITANRKPNAPLTPKFFHIAKVLRNPRTNLTFRVWAGESHSVETNIQFPKYIRDGEGVTLNQRDKSYSISAFYDERDIVKQLADLLPNMPALDDSLALEASLPVTALATLFGLMDLYRLADFVEVAPYSSADINGYIQGRWGLSNFENLLTYILSLGYDTSPPTQVEVEAALAMLVSMQIVEEPSEGYYALAPKLLPFVSALRGVLSGLQWERISMTKRDELLLINRLWLYGSDGLVLMLMPIGDRRVFISSVSIDEVKSFLVDELLAGDIEEPREQEQKQEREPQAIEPQAIETTQPIKARERLETPIPPTVASNEVKRCSVCDAPLATAAKFCTSCGTPVPKEEERTPIVQEIERVRKCSVCATELIEGAKFCTHCGTPVPKEEEIEKVKRCSACGVKLMEGAKFCTGCGARVS